MNKIKLFFKKYIQGSNNLEKNDMSKQLYQNILKLSKASSYSKEQRQDPKYDETRKNILADISKNLKDGADIHYYGEIHNDDLDTFQLAYVLDQDEAILLMLPYIRHHPPYYNLNCVPFLTHSFIYSGNGNVFQSGNYTSNFSVDKNIFQEYYDKYATLEEKQDLEEYETKTGKYQNSNPNELYKYYAKKYNIKDKDGKFPNCDTVYNALNTRKYRTEGASDR